MGGTPGGFTVCFPPEMSQMYKTDFAVTTWVPALGLEDTILPKTSPLQQPQPSPVLVPLSLPSSGVGWVQGWGCILGSLGSTPDGERSVSSPSPSTKLDANEQILLLTSNCSLWLRKRSF